MRKLFGLITLTLACSSSDLAMIQAMNTDGGTDGQTSSNQLAIYKSGTRIKMRVLRTADGATAFAGWRDTQRNEDCTIGYGTDRKSRCLPTGMAQMTGQYYADHMCTVRLAWRPVGCESATYAALFEAPNPQLACGVSMTRVYRVVGTHPQGAIYIRDSSGCRASNDTANYYFVTGAEVHTSEFAEWSEMIE